jgi:hypothetical protein
MSKDIMKILSCNAVIIKTFLIILCDLTSWTNLACFFKYRYLESFTIFFYLIRIRNDYADPRRSGSGFCTLPICIKFRKKQ